MRGHPFGTYALCVGEGGGGGVTQMRTLNIKISVFPIQLAQRGSNFGGFCADVLIR